MRNLKVAIIGAGISGLYLGWKLAEKGEDVTIFEKKNEIGNNVCSGLFSERILKFLPQSKELIQNKINFAVLHFPKKTVKLNFSKPFFVISHSELDKMAASFAKKFGVKIILGKNIDSLPSGFDKIIGCDGANSVVREILNLPEPKFRLGIQGFLNKEDFSDYVEVWPCQNGFLWKIPRGKETEYGIISNIKTAKKLFDDFLRKNNIFLERVGAKMNYSATETRSIPAFGRASSFGDFAAKIIPQGLIIPKNIDITLCGDAAGLTKPWSGGGVVWGLTANDILLKNFPNFSAYRKNISSFFYPKIILSKIAVKIVYFMGSNISWFLPKNVKIESDFLL